MFAARRCVMVMRVSAYVVFAVLATGCNSPPTARIDANSPVLRETEVVLDGSRSSDPDHNPITYHWTQLAGPNVCLSGADTAIARFLTPREAGVLTFQLTVRDNGWPMWLEGSSTVNITVIDENRQGPAAVTLESLVVNPSQVAGGTSVTGTVVLSSSGAGQFQQAVQVGLVSDNPSIARVPSSVSVPVGATTTEFAVTTYSTPSARKVTITASYSGVSRTAGLLVKPVGELASGRLGVDPNGAPTLDLTLETPAPSGGSLFHLISSRPDIVEVSPQLLIPEGTSSAKVALKRPPVDLTHQVVPWHGGKSPYVLAYRDMSHIIAIEFPWAEFWNMLGCGSGFRADKIAATNGEQITLRTYTEPSEGVLSILLRGFSYTQGPVFQDLNQNGTIESDEVVAGTSECIFCDCQTLAVTSGHDVEGAAYWQAILTIPRDAPPGEYEVIFVGSQQTCVGWPDCKTWSTVCPPVTHVTVLPPHIASVLEQMNVWFINDPGWSCNFQNPPFFRQQYVSAAASGSALGSPQGNQLVSVFPGWGYVPFSNLDFTRNNDLTSLPRPNLSLRWPLFVASEESLRTQGMFWAGLSGSVQQDKNMWGKVLSVMGGGLVAVGGCVGGMIFNGGSTSACGPSLNAGKAVGSWIQSQMGDCDRLVGSYQDVGQPDNWGITGHEDYGNFDYGLPGALTEGITVQGDPAVVVNVQHHRIGAPQVIECHVTLDYVGVSDFFDGCDWGHPAAQVFVQARAVLLPLQTGVQMPSCIRKPDAGNTMSVYPNPANCAPLRFAFGTEIGDSACSYSPWDAPRESILYIEVGVWDDDGGDSQNIGFFSTSVYLEDLFNRATTDTLDSYGNVIRKVRDIETYVQIPGWGGNDCSYCGGFKLSDCEIGYTVDVTFLRYSSSQ